MSAPAVLAETIPETLADAILTAAGLVDDLHGQQRRETTSYTEGYVCGWTAGHEAGYAAAEHDMAAAWSSIARRARALGSAVRPEWQADGRVADAERYVTALGRSHEADYMRRAPALARGDGDAAVIARATLQVAADIRAGRCPCATCRGRAAG